MKIAKRLVSLVLAAVLLMTSALSVSLFSYADELRYFERGILTDGNHTAYYLIDKDNKVLYITGDGNNLAYTPDYPSAAEGPFAGRTDITRIVIEEDVASVGDYALSNLKKADTLEVQSNLLSSSSSMSSKAMIGCTGLRHIQGDSALLSTDVFLEVVKGALNIASGNWLSLISNGVSIISTGVSGDDSLDNETVHCMVDDYINNGNKIFLADLDGAKEAYHERLANPCYSNNAFHHSYVSVETTAPTCTAGGVITTTCSVCGDVYTESAAALGHEYTASVLYPAECLREGITKYTCSRCGSAMYEAIPSYGGHLYSNYLYDEQADAYTEICARCGDENTQFDNDTSALISAVAMAQQLDAEDYTPASYQPLTASTARYTNLKEEDYLQYPQAIIDEKTADIIECMDALVPYLRLSISSSKGGSISFTANGETVHTGARQLEFGTEVTVTAVPADGSTFLGWYEKTTKRYLSTDETYTFSMTSNTDIVACFDTAETATLYFMCLDGQIKAYFQKTLDEWAAMSNIYEIAPEVPYSFGKTNGRWVYSDATVLAALQNGEDYTILPKYREGTVATYEKPVSPDGVTPAISLYYQYDETANVGNFIMMADIPQDCRVNETGIAFYYKNSEVFNPTVYRLNINNKMVTSRFEQLNDDGQYIVNFKKMNAAYGYAARGYVSYYDGEGVLQVAYSNQVNVLENAQVQ